MSTLEFGLPSVNEAPTGGLLKNLTNVLSLAGVGIGVGVVLALTTGVLHPVEWMTTFGKLIKPTNPTDFWTLVTGVSTLGLAGAAFRGLRSLRLARHDIRTRVKREALGCAIHQAEIFAKDILTRSYGQAGQLVVSDLPEFVNNASDVVFDPDDATQNKAKAWVKALDQDLRVQATELLNDLEAWAMHFTSGLADHKTAFGACGTPYIYIVVKFYPMLVAYRQHPLSGKYPNVVLLYQSWMTEQAEEGDKAALAGILQRAQELTRRQGRKGPRLPPTVGTDLD